MFIILLMIWALFAGLGYYVAQQKGRPEIEGLLLGFLFGPLGCLIVAMLPALSSSSESRKFAPRPARPSPWDRYADDPVEDQVMDYLASAGSKPRDSIDLGAIAAAATRDDASARDSFRSEGIDLGLGRKPAPPKPPTPSKVAPAAGRSTVKCACGIHLIPDEIDGHRVATCPKCGRSYRFPAARTRASAAAPAAPAADPQPRDPRVLEQAVRDLDEQAVRDQRRKARREQARRELGHN